MANPTLLDIDTPTKWNPDNWETPDEVAKYMASLCNEDECVLEPFAGTGQIAKYFNCEWIIANELCPIRRKKLWATIEFNDDEISIYDDSFSDGFLHLYEDEVDVVCTNPPFSRIVEAIACGLKFLNPKSPNARLLYLLPHDWDQAKGRNESFREMDCHIHHIHKIVGRVAYLKDGLSSPRRQVYDAIFDIRPGNGGCVSYFKLNR